MSGCACPAVCKTAAPVTSLLPAKAANHGKATKGAAAHLILLHDKTLDRTTTGHGKPSDFTLEEILKLRLRNGCNIKTTRRVATPRGSSADSQRARHAQSRQGFRLF